MGTVLKVAAGVVLGIFLLFAGCLVCVGVGVDNVATEMEAQTERIAVSNVRFEQGEYGLRYVRGNARNTSDKALSYGQIEINLYDTADNLIGSTLANVNNLRPGQNWQSEALVSEDRAVRAEISGTSGF